MIFPSDNTCHCNMRLDDGSSPPPKESVCLVKEDQKISFKRSVLQNTHFSPCHSLGGLPGLNPKGADDLAKESKM